MGELISRQAAKLKKVYSEERHEYVVPVAVLDWLPSAEPKQRWIPCNERLPEEHICDDGYVEPSDCVLVCGDYGNYGVSRYWGNRRSKSERSTTCKDWMDLDWVVQKPIAWMPLPEPFKEGEV